MNNNILGGGPEPMGRLVKGGGGGSGGSGGPPYPIDPLVPPRPA